MQSPKGAFKRSPQKITEEVRKENTYSGAQKTERLLAVNITINKNYTPPQTLPENTRSLKTTFSKNTCYQRVSF